MKIKEGKEKDWQQEKENNSTDSYSKCCVDFAVLWAKEMEARLEAQPNLHIKDIAESSASLVDKLPGMGITGFMYGAAVSMLSRNWVHGDDLRVWHNSQYGVGAETKGTVNPAIIHVGVSK